MSTETVQAQSDGIIAALAELSPQAIVDEAALSRIFGRCSKSIRRAVTRGELPRPVRLFGKPTWTAGAILDHLNRRLEEAKKESERLQRRISQLSA